MDAEDIELELEALQFTYAEAVTIHKELPLSVKVAIAPHTGADNGLSDLLKDFANCEHVKICKEALLMTWIYLQVETLQSSMLQLNSCLHRKRHIHSIHQSSVCKMRKVCCA